jgi:hypothetical protein
MPAHVQPAASLAITFIRDGAELDHRTAPTGARAVSVAMHMLSTLDELQPGDKLVVTAVIWP